MNLYKQTTVILVLIVALAAFLRLPFLGELPYGLTIDEAGQGYSAYSILKTGKDEWGDFLPLNPRGFGDYKPPVFMYLLIPSIAVFGLSEFAVRLPSAIAGILTVWVFFFLVKELFKDRTLGLISAFLLAISPWHVYYSRLGWESNVGLLFFCLGILFFIKANQKNIFLELSASFFGLAALSYHSFKLLVPLMVTGLLFFYFKEFKKTKKEVLIYSLGILILFALVLAYGFFFSGAGRRAADQSVLKEENLGQLRQIQYDDKLPQPFGRVLNNKLEFYISKVTDNYIGYYSLPFLFGPHRSDGSILNFPGKGLFYIWQLPLLIAGIFFLIKGRNKAGLVILLWTALAPVPASLTQDYQHAGRAQALFPALTAITAAGLVYIVKAINIHSLKLFGWLFSAIVLISLILRIDDYFFNTFNRPLGGLMQGYSEVISFTEKNKDQYRKIVFTKNFSEPQAFLAFYTNMDPEIFQTASQKWKGFENEGYRFLDMTDYSLGKYDFKKVDISRDRHEKNSLVIGSIKDFPADMKTAGVFKNLEGKPVFVAVETDEILE